MYLQGAVSKSLILGLYAKGSLQDATNNIGYTNWGGGMGGVTFQYNYSIKNKLYVFPGIGFGCGRFNYSSALNDGSLSLSIYSDAIYFEPRINISYAFWNKLLVTLEASYIIPLSSNNYQTATQNMEDTFPNGWFIGISIGYKSPLYKW